MNEAPVRNAKVQEIADLIASGTASTAIRRAIVTLDQDFLNLPSETDLDLMTRAGLGFLDPSGHRHGLLYLSRALDPALQHNRQQALELALQEVESDRGVVHAYIKNKGQGALFTSFLASPCRALLDKGRISASLQQVINTNSADMAVALNNVVKDHVNKLQGMHAYFSRGEEIATLTGSPDAAHVVLQAFMNALPEEGVSKGFDAILRRLTDTKLLTDDLITRILAARGKYGSDFMDRCIISCYPRTDVPMSQAFATGDRVAISCFKQNLFVQMSAPNWVEELTAEA